MKVKDLYAKTKALMYEKGSSTIYDQYLIANLNRIIDECFEPNNMERMFNDIPPLLEVPRVSTLEDEIVYEDVYANLIMPLGLASLFLIDDDLNKYGIYNTDYKNELIMNQKVVSQKKVDKLYGIARNTKI